QRELRVDQRDVQQFERAEVPPMAPDVEHAAGDEVDARQRLTDAGEWARPPLERVGELRRAGQGAVDRGHGEGSASTGLGIGGAKVKRLCGGAFFGDVAWGSR